MQSMDEPNGNTHGVHRMPLSSCCARTQRKARRAPAAALAWRLASVGLCAFVCACAEAEPPAPRLVSTAPSAAPSSELPTAPAAPAAEPWLANIARHPSEPAAALPCPARVPEALDPPADATLEQAYAASGVQVYACTQSEPGGAPSWVLEAPHALLTTGKSIAAIHFGGPAWQSLDGSSVKAARLASADAPDPGAVAWLLLSATPSGAGTFGKTTHIQRLDTAGGKPPPTGCDPAHLGARALVPYRAGYYFYRQAAAGEPIQQCRSGASTAR